MCANARRIITKPTNRYLEIIAGMANDDDDDDRAMRTDKGILNSLPVSSYVRGLFEDYITLYACDDEISKRQEIVEPQREPVLLCISRVARQYQRGIM